MTTGTSSLRHIDTSPLLLCRMAIGGMCTVFRLSIITNWIAFYRWFYSYYFTIMCESVWCEYIIYHVMNNIIRIEYYIKQMSSLHQNTLGQILMYVYMSRYIFHLIVMYTNNLPSHLSPCRKSPYSKDPQWSQNVGDINV